MADPEGELTVAQRLGRALDQGLLPAGGPAEAAERLIERLERPARVALLGLPGSGKSSILNLLVGSIVVPETLRLPTIIVQHGTLARMICTLTDGTTKTVEGSDLAQALPLAPALVTLEMDLPALKVINLLEVSAGPMEAEQRRSASWASKRADIVIWCSTSYLPKEQVVWESMPDGVKDNSFMFLTKVDLLGSRESASAMHDRVEQRAGEEFRQILSISAKQARAAMPTGGPVNRDLFRESGASAVITAIKTRVQSGRRADMDTAELLLARHAEASELVARRFAEPDADAPRSWTPPIEPTLPDTVPVVVATEDAPAQTEPKGDEAEKPEVLPEPESEVAVAPEAEPELEVESEPELIPEPEPEIEPEPEVAEETLVEPEPEEPAEPADETPAAAEAEPTTRKRFADRIKRVAASSEPASPPMVPLRSTWKSKNEAAPEPVAPPPPARTSSTAAPVADGDVARMLANVAAARERPAAPRERTPRAVPPPPTPAAEAQSSARRQLFGTKRPSADQREPESPLPDLSSLRAEPEDEGEGTPIAELEAETPAPEPEPQLDAKEPAAETVIEVPEPEVAAPRPISRPRLFDREPLAQPSEAVARPRPDPTPHATPIPRSPAPPRIPAPAAATSPPVRPSAADESQYSPRAIMMRERRVETEAPAPRRERPRIAARAVSAPAGPPEPVQIAAADLALLDEAIDLIVARSTGLEQEIDPEARVPVDQILDHSRETTEEVIAILSRGRSEDLRRINSDLGEVLDVIMLMQLEKGHAPADDALTLLLQLRRELETLRAA
jgi:hypothetical protein